MTYRATRPPQQGGWDLLKEWASREFTRIQQAFSRPWIDGTFTPGLDFATTGDLSNSYVAQQGRYWQQGDLIFFSIFLSVTPTHTTASGELRITGLPAPHSANAPRSAVLARVSGASVGWGGRTSEVGEISESASYIRIITTGENLGAQIINSTHVTTAVALNIRLSGFYPIK